MSQRYLPVVVFELGVFARVGSKSACIGLAVPNQLVNLNACQEQRRGAEAHLLDLHQLAAHTLLVRRAGAQGASDDLQLGIDCAEVRSLGVSGETSKGSGGRKRLVGPVPTSEATVHLTVLSLNN